MTTNPRACDTCLKPMESTSPVVEMGTYGLVFHAACFTALSGAELLHLMGEDETVVRQPDGSVLRARDARCITAAGTVTGEQEPVPL